MKLKLKWAVKSKSKLKLQWPMEMKLMLTVEELYAVDDVPLMQHVVMILIA